MSIKIGANLDFRGKDPNFARDQFETLSEMKSISDNAIDEGHISYCKETGLHYEFKSENSIDENTGKWREFKPGGENLNIDSDIDLEELSLNDTIFPLANDETAQLIVTKNYDSPITYKSSDEAIATVSETGLITKLANGEATITIKAGPKSTTAKVVNLITKNSNVLPLLNIPYLHSRGIKGQGVKVAIYEDLVKSSEEFTVTGWYDYITGTYSDTQPNPSNYHVSNHTNHMSTLICGKTRGVAPDCEFYNLYPGAGYNTTNIANGFMKCVDFCIENGIRVINDSIGFSGETCLANYRDAYKKAYDNNIIIVSALGNCDYGEKEIADENLWMLTANSLNIGACEKDGSHRSDTCIGRSMMFNNYGFSGLQAWNPSGKYNATSGRTSAAAGLTTGCVALLLCQDPTLTARQIYHILKDNAIQHTDYIQGEWNKYYGWGRINVPVLSNIKVKSDEECRLLDSKIEIVNTGVVIFDVTKQINLQHNAEGEYDVNVDDYIYISPIITPVEKDLYLSESITSNDNILHYSNSNTNINTFYCNKPGKCEITVIFKGISLQKKCIFNISE